jgi:hypothetical protein
MLDAPRAVLVSFALGALFAGSCLGALLLFIDYNDHYGQLWSLLAYFACLSVFHLLEFVMTGIFHPKKLSVDCT